MKSIQSKLGALVGSVVIAFAITLFTPSIASATYNSGSDTQSCSSTTDCSVYTQKAEYYKKKADYFLAKYNSTNCYTYYKYHLYYTNKYNYYKNKAAECQGDGQVNCDPYKEKAAYYKKYADKYKYYMDKYYALYKKYNNSCYYYYYQCYKKKYTYYMNLYNQYKNKYDECIANQTPTGNVCGVVYEDTNDNGTQDADETGVAGIEVSIIDANGETTTVTTDTDGKYCAQGIVAGAATITVDENTLPAGSSLTAGENPNDITVVANENNDAGSDGYTIPVLQGSIYGIVFEDINANNSWDPDVDKRLINVIVNVTDAAGNVTTLITNGNGIWSANDIAVGLATIDIDENTLPEGAVQVYGLDPSDGIVEAGKYKIVSIDGYRLDPLECPAGYESLNMTVWTKGKNTSDNLQTVLPIDITGASSITFANVKTSDINELDQPYEQFMIVAVDDQAQVVSNTGWTNDINNETLEIESTDLGTLELSGDVSQLLLVHRADPVYGEDIPYVNSVSFRGLCYQTTPTTNHP